MPLSRNSIAVLLGISITALLSVGACGSGTNDSFATTVVPYIEKNCLSTRCHGVALGAEADGEVINWEFFFIEVSEDGKATDRTALRENLLRRINTTERAEFSSLVRKPLAVDKGGELHLGGVQFPTTEEAGYRLLVDWIKDQSGGGEGHTYDELSTEQQFFAENILPALSSRQCMNQACHGLIAPFTSFATPITLDGVPVFSISQIKKNYKTARKHIFTSGDPMLSRLIRKVIPMEDGGIPHRGGNDIFFRSDDPTILAIAEWAEMEQQNVLPGPRPEVTGVVFVRGPVASQGIFEHDAFVPGTDLFVLSPATPGGTVTNLTSSIHTGPADIRAPAVSHDGDRVVFAMRRNAADSFNIYEMQLSGGGLRQLTDDAGVLPGGVRPHNVQPTYGPDGRVFFASTRAGHMANGYDVPDTEIWAVDLDDGALERITYSPSPEVTPTFFTEGKIGGELAFTMRTAVGPHYDAPSFRVPLDRNKKYHGQPEIHIHHGITADEEVSYDTRCLPEGRYASIQMERDNVWRGGRLAIYDRQLGPEVPRGDEDLVTSGGFLHAFTNMDDAVASTGPSTGFYRDPSPMPDGRLLVSYSNEAIDLSDPAATPPELGIFVAEIVESRANGGPVLGSMTQLADEPGVAEFSAEPIMARELEDDPGHTPGWDPTYQKTTGFLAFRHVETLEALFSNLPQTGTKPIRTDLEYVRLVESLPVTPEELAASPVGLGVHGRTQILDEIPLKDGSMQLEVPSDRPFRVQFLNADRMAVGTQHNRWIHVAPGETFPGGVSKEIYPLLCASCHGSLSGDIKDQGGTVPDAIAGASINSATHQDGDSRRPIPAVRAGLTPSVVDFRRDIQPLLNRSCAASCHQGATPDGGLDLVAVVTAQFDSAYEALLAVGAGSGHGRAYVDERASSAHNSHLIERIYGRELGATRRLEIDTCRGEPALSAEERLLFVKWIDTGAVYRGLAE